MARGDHVGLQTGTGRTVELRPTLDHPDTLHLYSLEALVTMVKTEAANMDAPLYITIPDHPAKRHRANNRADILLSIFLIPFLRKRLF